MKASGTTKTVCFPVFGVLPEGWEISGISILDNTLTTLSIESYSFWDNFVKKKSVNMRGGNLYTSTMKIKATSLSLYVA